MSVTVDRVVICPACAGQFPLPVYWSLHATRSPELRQAILDRGFQHATCPDCGRTVQAEPTLLYTDFPRGQWFATFPTRAVQHSHDLARLVEDGFHRNMRVAAPPMVKAWADRFEVRLVFGLPALREKLLCHDLGIDDRLLELAKLRLLRDTAPRLLDPKTRVTLDALVGDTLELEVVPPPGPDGTSVVQRVGMPRARLDELQPTLDALGQTWPGLATGCEVDWRVLITPQAPLPQGEHAGLDDAELYPLLSGGTP